MTGMSRASTLPLAFICVVLVTTALQCRWSEEVAVQGDSVVGAPVAGGTLRVGIRSAPQTWNRILATDAVTHQITERLNAPLLRINRVTQELEPELAESWSFSEDGRELTFKLRPNVTFSDGQPFTADDVAFTFRAIHDPQVASTFSEVAAVEGKPLVPEVVDPLTVRFKLPFRTAAVGRIFDSIVILPRHRLEASLEQGNFPSEYGIGASEDTIVGLGPFVLEHYVTGQRVVLRRNPNYWKYGPAGVRLPYLDGMSFEILPDANALALRFSAGELDLLSPLPSEHFASLREKQASDLRLIDLGPGTTPERIWFNLNPEGSVSPEQRAWFIDRRFRRAISLAIDRRSIGKLAYADLASPAAGPITPSNRLWWNESIAPPPYDPQRARELLAEAGFKQEGDVLRAPGGEPVRFTLLTNTGNPFRMKTATLVQEDLARIGVEMHLVPLDFAALIGRVTRSFDYQACLLGITFTDPDPSAQRQLWSSRSPLHLWHPSQPEPASSWEERLDEIMDRQMLAVRYDARKALIDELQAIVVEELPVIDLVVPHALVGTTVRLGNLEPTPFWHPTLWNSEALYLTR